MQYNKLKKLLDTLYLNYKHKYSSKDPVWNLHRFSDKKDIELTGLITAAYAYGSVDLINRFIELFLNKISNKPYEFIINFSKHKDKKYINGLNYRFYGENELLQLILSIKKVLIKYNSLENLFMKGFNSDDDNILKALEKFSHAILTAEPAKAGYFPSPKLDRGKVGLSRHISGRRLGDDEQHKNYFHYMISNPANGSACKRMNLFLRWMVRNDEIDTGIWKGIPSSKLIIPVDVHIARAAGKLNLVERKSVDIIYALELTNKLKQFDPDDPVKYDFSLCHFGIDKKSISELLKHE